MNSTTGQLSLSHKITSYVLVVCMMFSYLMFPLTTSAALPPSTAVDLGTTVTPNAGLSGNTVNIIAPSSNQPVYTATPTPRPSSTGADSGGGGGLAGGLGAAVASVGACLYGGGLLSMANAVKTVPVNDKAVARATGGDNVKNCLLDGMAFQLKEALVKGIIQGVIGFINSGFSGGAGYMQDEDSLFLDLQDEQFNTFINDSQNFSSLCSAWAPDVRLALAVNYSTSVGGKRVTQISDSGTGTPQPLSSGEPEACRLENEGYSLEGSPDEPDFWSNFLTQTTTTGGNPLTSFFSIQDRLAEQAAYVATKKANEIARGQGFFDNVDCSSGASQYSSSPGSFTIGGVNCSITTPSRVVAEQTNNALGSDLRRLELSDEFDEIFSQLVAMLIQMILGQMGLSGVSERSGGSSSFIEQYAEETNPTAVINSREDLTTVLGAYKENAAEYLSYKRQSLQSITATRDAILNLYTCYKSKYDTWVRNSDGSVIAPEDLSRIPESQRHRATFKRDAVVGGGTSVTTTIYLTPEQSEKKLQEYEALLEETDGYIRTLVYEIDAVELNIAKAIGYETEVGAQNTDAQWLQNTISSSTILAQIETEFANRNDNVVVVPTTEPAPSTTTGATYNLDDVGKRVATFSRFEAELSSVRFEVISFTINPSRVTFPAGRTTMPVRILYRESSSPTLKIRQEIITKGQESVVVFSGLKRNTSYDFYFSADENLDLTDIDTLSEIADKSISVATNTTGTRTIPRNLTIEQIIQVYTVAIEELPVYDAVLASNQYEQVLAANEDLLYGRLQSDGVTRSGGISADLQICTNFSEVLMPVDESSGSNTR